MDAMMLIPKKKNRKQRVLMPWKKKKIELERLKYELMFVEELKKRGFDDEELKKHEREHMLVKEPMKLRLKKKKKKKKKKRMINEKIPELKVLNMDIDTLKLYLFPNDPRVPFASDPVQELNILQQLDGTSPNYHDIILCDKPKHVNSATQKLKEFILAEFQRTSFEFNTTGYDIHLGKYLNIKSLLFSCPSKDYLIRKNGRKVFAANLEGKYVMICCCFLPVCWESYVWQAVLACFEMYSKLNGDFEMVIVAKMRRGWTHDESAFNQFFDAFPSSCLAVPFHAQSRHHLICESLSFNDMAMNKTLLVDPNGIVLQCKGLTSRSNVEFVPLYGSDPTPFPFLSRKFELVNRPTMRFRPIPTDAWMKLTPPTSLEDLLCTDFVFRKVSLGNGAFSEVKVSISELKSKFVGLYLYNTGRLLPLLRDIIKEASRQSNKDGELEIIVVYIPTDCNHDLRLYPEFFSRALAKRNISLWVAPFNNTATVMLTHFFDEEDRVVIVGPNGLCIDPRGAELMQIYGMYAYPFTFDCVVQKTVKELRQVTLENFIKFLDIQGYPLVNNNKVLFYFDWPWNVSTDVYGALEHFTKCEDVCIIAVSFNDEETFGTLIETAKLNGPKDRDKTLELNWHTKSADKSLDFFCRFFNGPIPTIVAFGKNGKICSVCADRLSSSSSAAAAAAGARAKVKGNLLEEVSSMLNRDARLYNIDELLNFDEDAMQEMQKLRETMLW